MMTHSPVRRVMTICLLLAAWPLAAGCIHMESRGEILHNSMRGVETVVVAPMMNLSANANVDTIEVTKRFISELQQVGDIDVVPMGRVYQYLADNNMATVGSPEEARALAEVFKAQATIVGAVTEYDPYDPPRMGLAIQVYSAGAEPPALGEGGFDPVNSARAAAPFPVADDAAGRPKDMIIGVFSGRDVEVMQLAKVYASRRSADGSPYGWRRFLIDQHEFQRLCCYGVIREMMGEAGRQEQKPAIKIGPVARNWPK